MIKESITIDEVLDALNRMVSIDNEAMKDLCFQRVRCNKKMSHDMDVQVVFDDSGQPMVGLLGVLNGLFGHDETKGFGPIAAKITTQCSRDRKHNIKGVALDEYCGECYSEIEIGTFQGFVRRE